MWKRFASDYLAYTKKERTGIFVIIGFIIILIVVPFLYPLFLTRKPADASAFNTAVAALSQSQQDSGSADNYPTKHQYTRYSNVASGANETFASPGEVFFFDPNTASAADWKRLGVREKTIGTIQKYLLKGGHFKSPADLGKVWGLRPEQVSRLVPYVKISQQNEAPVKSFEAQAYTAKFTASAPVAKKMIDINLADTTEFISLPGIGSKLANRIINFRTRLGGFYSPEQVGETFGIPDSTFQNIKGRLMQGETGVTRININTATLEQLKAHPYIRYTLANPIIAYRTQHGNFAAVADLKKIMLVNDEVFRKLQPYLSISE